MPSNTSSNKAVVPEAKGALDRFKYEVANELGVPLTDGYNCFVRRSVTWHNSFPPWLLFGLLLNC